MADDVVARLRRSLHVQAPGDAESGQSTAQLQMQITSLHNGFLALSDAFMEHLGAWRRGGGICGLLFEAQSLGAAHICTRLFSPRGHQDAEREAERGVCAAAIGIAIQGRRGRRAAGRLPEARGELRAAPT